METVQEAFTGASLVVMQNNHVDLERLQLAQLTTLMQAPGLIYDYWNQHSSLSRSEVAPGVEYRALGAFNLIGEEN
jgi:hypothetical protein